MTEYIPGRHRTIWVTGWEPLGNLCYKGCYAATEAQPYRALEPQAGSGKWQGTWGRHYFTLGNLITRANAYWCQFSEDIASFDYVQFCGGVVKIPQTAACPWMISFDEYLQVKLKAYDPRVTEDKWGHPGIMINDLKTHMIFPPSIYQKKRMYKIPIKPPPGWKGLQRLPDADGYICTHWLWTWWDPTRAFFDAGQSGDQCEVDPWWGGQAQNKIANWVNRSKYETCSSSVVSQETWGPFLPCKYEGYPECSLFFMYKLKFKVVGNALWRPLPRNIDSQGLVPEPPGRNGGRQQDPSQTEETHSERERPQSEADVWDGDLDSTGIIKDDALQRIIRNSSRSERRRRRLERDRRLRHLAAKLTRILGQRKLLKLGRDHPPDPPLTRGGHK